MRVTIVVAATPEGVIGVNGGLPWPRIPQDMAHFAKVTTTTSVPGARNAVIMGQATWASLRGKPLRDRINIVLSTTDFITDGGADADADADADAAYPDFVCPTMADALAAADAAGAPEAFVIGGARPIVEVLQMQSKQPGIHLVLTRVVMNAASPADNAAELAKITTVPQLTEAALLAAHWAICGPVTQLAPGVSVALWVQHVRPAVPLCAPLSAALSAALSVLPHPEQQYLELVARVLATGEARDDRTGVGTRAVFGARLEFSLADNVMPVLTTKRVFWKGVVHELLWFLRGCTDARALSAAGVRIWDGNASRAALDARGLTDRAEGDLGPVYGFQWRHFGAPYVTADTDYRGAGVDQIKALVHGLRTDPVGRRHILSAWNPADLPAMALPPCHILAQFWIGADGLSCQMYQRSADLGLGVPFNIASYALLTHLLAACVGRPAARLIMVFGDTHIYSTHEEALREQLTRRPRSFPKLELKRSSGAGEGTSATLPDMDSWVVADIVLNNYNPHPPIPMPMAV